MFTCIIMFQLGKAHLRMFRNKLDNKYRRPLHLIDAIETKSNEIQDDVSVLIKWPQLALLIKLAGVPFPSQKCYFVYTIIYF